jgi:hypothetical protein
MRTSSLASRAAARKHRHVTAISSAVACAEFLETRRLLAANAWKAAVSGDWDLGSNWSAGHVPTSGEDVSIAVAGTYTITHTSGVTDQVKSLTISSSGATLSLNGGKIQDAGATSVTAGTLNFQGGTLLKGSLSVSGSGHFTVTGSGILDGVTIASNLTVSSATLFLYHTVTLNAGKVLTATDGTLYLYDQSDGGASIAGSGEVVLNGTSGGTMYLYNGSGHNATVSATTKIHGYGTVYNYGGTNVATIVADQNGKTLSVGGATWVNNGTLSAINGGILTISGTWSSPTPGKLNETSSSLNLGGTIGTITMPTRSAGTITLTGVYDLKGGTLALTATTGSWSVQSGTIKNGTISLAGGATLNNVGSEYFDKVTLASNLTVSGGTLFMYHANTLATGVKLTVTDGTLYLYDQPDSGASLNGTGEVILNGTSGGNLYLYNGSGHTATIASTIKVHGFGSVYFYAGTNNGTITADQSGKTLSVGGATWVNKGTLSATGGGILTISGTWSSPSPGVINENASTLNLGGTIGTITMPTRTGGTINLTGVYNLGGGTLALTATTGSWSVQSGTVKNATINLSGGAQLVPNSSAYFDHVTFATNFAFTTGTIFLYHANTLATGVHIVANDGTVYLYDQPDGGASLNGTGEVLLGSSSGGNLYLYNGNGHVATVAATVLVHGFGTVYYYAGGNSGTIKADVAGKTLTVTGTSWVNKGTLSAINGATLTLSGTNWSSPSPGAINETNSTIMLSGTFSHISAPVRTGGTITLNGIYDLTGGTLAMNATTGNWNFQGGTVKNGTLTFATGGSLVLNSSGYFDGVTLASNYTIGTATLFIYHTCTLSGGVQITNTSGTIYLYDQPDAGAALSGTGQVILGGTSANLYLYNGNGHAAVIGSGVRVHGFGTVYSYASTINGIIEADVSGKTLLLNGSAMTNKGILRASHGGTLQIQNPSFLTNQGALAAEGGTVLISGAFNTGASGIIDIGIGGTGQGTTYGLINCTGALTLAGTINTYLINGFKPANGATFTVLKYASKTGAFTKSNFNAGGGVSFTPTFGGTSLSLKASTSAASVASLSSGTMTLNGTSGNDTLAVTDSLGVVTASLGGVTSVFSSAAITGIAVNGGDGNDIISYTGNTIPSTLSGGNGNDSIVGSNAADVLIGGAGNDTTIGNGGNDRYVFAAATAAEVDVIGESSGGGNDTLDFSAMTTAVTVKLNSDTLATMTNRTVKTQTAGQFANIENVVGGSGNDSITGNAAANSLSGGAGNDTFFVQDGTTNVDSVDGGAGTDVVSSKDAVDIITNVP